MSSSNPKTTGPATPVKIKPSPKTPNVVENSNPNLANRSPLIKSAKGASRNPNPCGKKKKVVAPTKEKLADGDGNCSPEAQAEKITAGDGQVVLPNVDAESVGGEVSESSGRVCRSNIKRGKVMNLIQAFERILTLPPRSDTTTREDECASDSVEKVKKWPLMESPETMESSSSSSCQLESFGTPDTLHSDTWDGSLSHESISKRTSGGSRRNSSESSGTSGVTSSKKKKLRVTNQKPFKLRTEQRGKVKEVKLLCKIQQMIEEQERKRLRIAQGLPWTTDEPQCLLKPPVKEITRPLDVKLHTDMRAVDRAEFDHQVAEKMSLFEQYKMERVRQQKLAEEEEIRRLRKELVPKAQPMPFFDKPFVPKRSSTHHNRNEPSCRKHNVRRSNAGCTS